MFAFTSPWIRLSEVPRVLSINPAYQNGKCFIYIIDSLVMKNASFFFPKEKKWWRCLLEEQTTFQTEKLLLFVWCLGSLLYFLRWKRRDSCYHVGIPPLRKNSFSFCKKNVEFLNRGIHSWKYPRVLSVVMLTEVQAKSGI